MNKTVVNIDNEFAKNFLSLVSLHNCAQEKESSDSVTPAFVEEYRKLLKFFNAKLGESLSAFEIPSSAMSDRKPHRMPGWCEKPIFLSKTSALVNYIDQIHMLKEPETKIGFRLT